MGLIGDKARARMGLRKEVLPCNCERKAAIDPMGHGRRCPVYQREIKRRSRERLGNGK